MTKICIGHGNIVISSGISIVAEVKACLFVNSDNIESSTTNRLHLNLFIEIDGKYHPVYKHGEQMIVDLFDMTKEDWKKYGWAKLVT